jgi:phospholipid/cholesterol/gamma-HCH transport system permease protein
MMDRMRASLPSLGPPGRAALRWWRVWWHIVHLGALVAALATLPSSYARARRPVLARHLVRTVGPVLPSFAVVSALTSLVLARIVIVTAASYGLTQFALGMVVRVLVLELIPLAAALFVAVRITVPATGTVAAMRRSGGFTRVRAAGGDVLRDEIAPRAMAGLVSVLMLAALASVITLVLAYVLVHGFSPWGFERFTRQVGQVFTPSVTLIFGLKTLAFGTVVSVVPLGSALHDPDAGAGPLPLELQGLVRLLLALLVIEVLSLVGNYH